MNICGCLVHVAPRHETEAARQIAETDGCEIHAQSDDGRYVVVVEDTETRLASETIMALHQITGVVSLTLSYHHFEPFPSATKRAGPFTGDPSNDRV